MQWHIVWGTWTELEATNHINYLEMLAMLFGLQTFAKDKENTHIRIRCDNTTVVNIIKNTGTSHSEKYNKLAYQFGSGVLAGAYGSGKLKFCGRF